MNMGAGASSIPDSLSEEDSKALLSSIGEDEEDWDSCLGPKKLRFRLFKYIFDIQFTLIVL